MNAAEIADIFEEIAFLLELGGENQFKIRAFANATRLLRAAEGDFVLFIENIRNGKVKGFGPQLSEYVLTLAQTGTLPYFEQLKSEIPPGVLELFQLPGLGAKKIKILREHLQIENIADLKKACKQKAILEIPGFGEKTVQNLLAAITRHEVYRVQLRIDTAETAAQELCTYLQRHKSCVSVEPAGPLRRKNETVSSIELLAVSEAQPELVEAFVRAPGIKPITAQNTEGPAASGELAGGAAVHLVVAAPQSYAAALLRWTGSESHYHALAAHATSQGLELRENGLYFGNERIDTQSEAALYNRLGLAYIEPELREGRGEIEVAAEQWRLGSKDLPPLITEKDLTGVLHVHTSYSDGTNSLEEMAWGAKRLGFHYLGIADHSQSARYAGGLSPDAIRRQHEDIDRLNEKFAPFRIFKGIESDILADGTLDYSDEILASFDFVLASVHSQTSMPKRDMTKRVITALENPRTTILGHPTGRLLLKREAYEIDLDAVLEAAAHFGVAVELNANPRRLDLDWRFHQRARELGILIPICPDAHSVDGYSCLRYGISIARKGGLEKRHVLNTWNLSEVEEFFSRRRSK